MFPFVLLTHARIHVHLQVGATVVVDGAHAVGNVPNLQVRVPLPSTGTPIPTCRARRCFM